MGDVIRIAIDGPSGAGKSTIAKKVSARLGIEYVDTGAMYRAVGYKMKGLGVSPEDVDRVRSVMEETDIDFDGGKVFLDGEDVSGSIRTPEISEAASAFSALEPVRTKLVAIQREIGHRKSVLMDGRDIGTNVFPDAQFKFFLTATAEERATRRYKELVERGEDVEYDEVLRDIEARDYNDTHRKLNPLKMADDAVEVDSTHMTIEQVVDHLTEIIERGK